jgi:starvation-inducible DNA-binding protein
MPNPKRSDASAQTAMHLQRCLSALIDLSLQTKQAHWNCSGPHFRPVHLQLDELAEALRSVADEVAERIATLEFPAEGSLSATAKRSPIEPLPDGFREAIGLAGEVAKRLRKVTVAMREAIQAVGPLDPISEDLLVASTRSLEKQLWMLAALERK